VSTDNWCTPRDLARMLGPFDTDPCSNPSSHIQASRTYAGTSPEDDGLTAPWFGSVFVNGPYSDPLPWCKRLVAHDGPWVALWKLDPSTRWWAVLMEASPTVAPFRKRLKFEGEKSMTANFPSVLIYSAWRPCVELMQHLWLPTYAPRLQPERSGG